jgi:hypothetical protein
MNWKVAWGILKHDIKAYIQSYKVTCEWAQKYPGIPADDFAALQDAAWADIEQELAAETEKHGPVVLRSAFAIPDGEKN